MKTGTLIHYFHNKKIQLKEKERFRRIFLGFKDKSNYGEYTYKRKGALNQIPHLKIGRSTIIINDKDRMKIVNLLKQFKLKYFARKIILNKEDWKVLSVR